MGVDHRACLVRRGQRVPRALAVRPLGLSVHTNANDRARRPRIDRGRVRPSPRPVPVRSLACCRRRDRACWAAFRCPRPAQVGRDDVVVLGEPWRDPVPHQMCLRYAVGSRIGGPSPPSRPWIVVSDVVRSNSSKPSNGPVIALRIGPSSEVPRTTITFEPAAVGTRPCNDRFDIASCLDVTRTWRTISTSSRWTGWTGGSSGTSTVGSITSRPGRPSRALGLRPPLLPADQPRGRRGPGRPGGPGDVVPAIAARRLRACLLALT
jgi:hypothetical protein